MSDITLSKAVRANLLSLQSTADLMAKTQERLATGNKVNSALDNPTNFFTASALNSRAGDLNSLMDNMANGIKTIEAADNGLSSITKTLESMQSTLRQARQDKSFQVGTFDVTADSILKLNGGTLPAGIEVKLDDPYAGKKATVATTAPYTGPALGASAVGGARAEVTWDATMDGTVDMVTVDGVGLDLSDVAITDAATAATAIGTQLGADYDVSEAGGVISIEKVNTSADAPVVTLGTTAAISGSAKFLFDPVRMGATINVDGNDVTVAGDLATFTTALQTELGTDYTVTSDTNTNEVTVRANTPGLAATPVISGGNLGATVATTSFALDNTHGQALVIGGQQLMIGAGASDADVIAAFEANGTLDAAYSISATAPGEFEIVAKTAGAATAPAITSDARASTTFTLDTTLAQNLTLGGTMLAVGAGATDAAVIGAFTANGPFNAAYSITSDGAGNFTLVSKVAGPAAETAPAVSSSQVAQLTAPVATNVAINVPTPVSSVFTEDGKAAVSVTTVNGINGATVETFDAPADLVTVTYGTKTLELSIHRGTQEEMAEAINDQFSIAGMDLQAKFDATGNLSFEATKAEGKTLAVSGATANTLFGANTVSIGEDSVAELNATKAVDKFVELINRDHGTSIRASNDNGRLRIENLSTGSMTVEADKNGNGAVTTASIAGNSVRAGLADQYNDLKNQLDRLADDASFNGINLLRGDNLRITFNESGNSFIEIQTGDHGGLNANTLKIDDLDPGDLDADVDIDSLLAGIKQSLNTVRTQASQFGSNLSIVQNRQDFTKQMINTLETGAANLTLADMNEEAANLLALQTRQSLSSSSLSLASQADQSVLQLLQ